ncbi:IS630 family transposase [Aureimonas leprariae]|uniref:IS630 family transposase n=2 Tax=Plantimonas leprariae TaxID=2615207 RepID=A0A7V7TUD0_9HYPH|nr:IS630 family transposase [Aureimonas leprariae]KAB0676033.1 IS630 family transposase [Aureimonas leprariae]
MVLGAERGLQIQAVQDCLGLSRASQRRYRRLFRKGGAPALFSRKAKPRKRHDEELKAAVFRLLHEPPANYGINRTSWRIADLCDQLRAAGTPACQHVVSQIVRDAGYKWRKARVVLTSADPAYSEKLAHVQAILSRLQPDEAFFSIDEFGPFSIRTRGGSALTAPGEERTVPQWQRSRGRLIMTAALELSGNQVTHFYSAKKNTAEMIRMMDTLVARYADRRRLYLSWDAASWHVSKALQAHIEAHNAAAAEHGGPTVETAPLPAGAQFLNVIEAVFSGMARAIVHNSDYGSVDEAKAAIDRYFEKRNAHFREHPQRAGRKIWGLERTPAVFSDAATFKDPAYR